MPRQWRRAALLIAVALLVAGCSLLGGSTGPSPVPASVPPAAQGAVDASVSALASQLGVDRDTIVVVSVEATDWPDTSLGCPAPDMMYAQVVTPGFLVVLDARGTTYQYHTDATGQQVATCTG
jgi:hypothetical protein